MPPTTGPHLFACPLRAAWKKVNFLHFFFYLENLLRRYSCEHMNSVAKTSVAGVLLVVVGFAFCCLTLCAAGLLHLPEIYSLAQQHLLSLK